MPGTDKAQSQILKTGVVMDPIGSIKNTKLEEVGISGYGIGLQMSLPGTFLARLDVATQLSGEDPSDDDDPQYYFTLNYEF